MSLHCPACGHKQVCPCETCDTSRQATGRDAKLEPWKWVGGLGMRCGKCGFEGSANFWAKLEQTVESWGDNALLYPIKKDLTQVTLKFLDKLKEDKDKRRKHEENTNKE